MDNLPRPVTSDDLQRILSAVRAAQNAYLQNAPVWPALMAADKRLLELLGSSPEAIDKYLRERDEEFELRLAP